MQQIVFFFIRNKNFLLFLLLFITSIVLTINTHSFHKNKVSTSANFLSGGIYSFKQDIMDYLSLGKQNRILIEENNRLRQLLTSMEDTVIEVSGAHLDVLLKFKYISARVINNSYSRSKNHLTLNKGRNDGIKVDMGVISSKGVVGIVNNVSANYATVQSVLNTKSQINAKLKNTEHFGTLIWETESPYEAILIDIPRQVQLRAGDTVVTDGKSTIFPEGILVGTVKEFELAANKDYFNVTISLLNDMTSLRHVYVIENNDSAEIKILENAIEDAE